MKNRRVLLFRYESFSLIICAALCLCTVKSGFSQNIPYDNPDLRDARHFFKSDQIDDAQAVYEALENEHCQEYGDPEVCLETKFGLIDIAQRYGNDEAAESLAVELEEHISLYLEKDVFYRMRLARFWLLRAIATNQLEEAAEWVNRLKTIIDIEQNDPQTLVKAHDIIGYYEDMLGNYEEAISHYKLAIELAEKINSFELKNNLLLSAHNNLGVSYKNMGMLDEAKKEYEISLDIVRTLFGDKNIDEARAFINIGAIYYSKGDFGRAAEFFRRSTEIYRSLTGDFGRDIGASLNNLAGSQLMLGNLNKSAEYFEEAQRLKEESLGYDHPETAIGYSNLAAIYTLNNDFRAARENIERSIDVREAVYGPDHPNLIEPLISLGNLYNNFLKQYDEARIHYQSALDIANDRLGEAHPDVTDIYLQIGKAYIENGIYSDAEQYIDSAIKNLYGDYDFDRNIDLDRAISNPITLVYALSHMARILKERNEGVSNGDYEHALMALEWAADLVDFLQKSFKNEASKLQLVESNYSIYTDAIEILATLYKENGNGNFKDRIFETIEKSRSRVALELIQKVNAKKYAGVPEEIIKKESHLNKQITRLQKQLYQEESEGIEKDSALFAAIRDSIFNFERELEDFTDKLEEEFPSYHSLKYDQSVISRQDAQSLLQDDEVALSYVLGSNQAFVLVISENDINLVELGKTLDINSLVLELKDQVLTDSTEEYKKTAHELYKRLIQPLEQYVSGKKLLVMADQALHYLPFELLLKEVPDHHQFHRFPYIVHDYTISYIPSLTLLSEMSTRVVENPKNLLAVAPFSSEIAREDAAFMDHRYSGSAKPLYMTQYETATISSQFQSRRSLGEYFSPKQAKLLMGNDATFSRFSGTGLSDYDYIHFATHAFINEENPEYSAILLYPEEENPGVAYVGDIYNLDLDANLVVLGACQTGMGSIYRGEGLIGFTRAFIYAGASNLTVSMWRVSDQPTAYLMIDFYDLIRQGYDYSEALRQAKLNLISKPQFANPVNWAAFTLIGR